MPNGIPGYTKPPMWGDVTPPLQPPEILRPGLPPGVPGEPWGKPRLPGDRPPGEETFGGDPFTYGGFLGLIPEEQRRLIGMSPEQLAEHFGLGPEYAEYFTRIDPERIQEVLGQIVGERGERLGMAQEQYGLGAGRARETGQMGLLGLTRRLQAARAGGGFAGAGAVERAGGIEARGLRAGFGQEMGRLGQARYGQRFQAGQQAQTELDRLLALITGQLETIPETALRIEALDPGDQGALTEFGAKELPAFIGEAMFGEGTPFGLGREAMFGGGSPWDLWRGLF